MSKSFLTAPEAEGQGPEPETPAATFPADPKTHLLPERYASPREAVLVEVLKALLVQDICP